MSGSPCLVFQTTSSLSSWPPRVRSSSMMRVAMVEIVPKQLGVEQIELFLLVAEQVPHPPIVKQDPPVLVDDADRRRAEVQNFAKLALLLDDLRLVLGQRGDVVNPQHALAAGKTDVSAVVGDLHIGQQQMDRAAFLGPPDHPLVDELTALLVQRLR